METEPPKKEQKEKQKQSLNSLARYSGMAFQIGGAVILGILLGTWMDKQFEPTSHCFTALFAVLGVFIGVYAVFRDLLKKK
jgi:F0F1-type ATP synthase assembly protein I